MSFFDEEFEPDNDNDIITNSGNIDHFGEEYEEDLDNKLERMRQNPIETPEESSDDKPIVVEGATPEQLDLVNRLSKLAALNDLEYDPADLETLAKTITPAMFDEQVAEMTTKSHLAKKNPILLTLLDNPTLNPEEYYKQLNQRSQEYSATINRSDADLAAARWQEQIYLEGINSKRWDSDKREMLTEAERKTIIDEAERRYNEMIAKHNAAREKQGQATLTRQEMDKQLAEESRKYFKEGLEKAPTEVVSAMNAYRKTEAERAQKKYDENTTRFYQDLESTADNIADGFGFVKTDKSKLVEYTKKELTLTNGEIPFFKKLQENPEYLKKILYLSYLSETGDLPKMKASILADINRKMSGK
jgi:hypothetical protein